VRPFGDHFCLVAPWYDRIFGFLDPTRLRRLLALPTTSWALDAGGGTGRVAHTLRDAVGSVVVLDESAGMLRQARRKGLPAIQGEMERLPFADETFARVLMVDTFHHLRDQGQAAAELVRVLSPAGRLVLEEQNVELFSIRLVALAEKLALMRSHFHSPRAVQQIMEHAGGTVRLERDGINFWAVVEKTGPRDEPEGS